MAQQTDNHDDALTSKSYWSAHWGQKALQSWDSGGSEFIPDWHQFFLSRFGEEIRNRDYFEAGCYPGRYMRYFEKKFDMRVFGLDLMECQENDKNAAGLAVEVGDFLLHQASREYDLVCSFGFIEHFSNVGEVIAKHLDYTRKGGVCFITVPNYSESWRFSARRFFDAGLFDNHNKDAMRMDYLHAAMEELNCYSFEVERLRYSTKVFSKSPNIRKVIGLSVQKLLRLIPYLDEKFATEILICIRK